MSSVKDACTLMEETGYDRGISALNPTHKLIAKYKLDCAKLSYSSEVSVHTKKKWLEEYDGYFIKPSRHTKKSELNHYKKWGIGEKRFFTVSDNFTEPKKSSKTFYFHLNRYNMPRLMGATFYDAKTKNVTEYSFNQIKRGHHAQHFRPSMGLSLRDREQFKTKL